MKATPHEIARRNPAAPCTCTNANRPETGTTCRAHYTLPRACPR